MTQDLIQKLKTCKPEERKTVAIELASTGETEIVSELIRIADGGEYTPEKWVKPHWYSFRRKISDEKWEYKLDDQLDAIKALGETKNKIALDYARKLLERQDGPGYSEGGSSACADWSSEYSKYAKGDLYTALYGCSVGPYAQTFHENKSPDERAMNTIQSAVKNLKAGIKKHEEYLATLPQPAPPEEISASSSADDKEREDESGPKFCERSGRY